jgi:flagellar hook capping protein FlgD
MPASRLSLVPRAARIFLAVVSAFALPSVAQGAWFHDGFTHVPLATTANGGQAQPVAISDGAGGALVAWLDTRFGNNDIFIQRVTGNGAIAPGWPVDGRAVCTAPFSQADIQMISDGAGGAILAWRDFRQAGANNDIYAQRVLANGTVAWTANGVAVAASANHEYEPAICSDGAGGVIVVYQYVVSGTDHDIYRARVSSSGVLVVPPTPLYAKVDYSQNPTAVSDGAGGCITAFQSNFGGTFDIVAIRFNNAGNVWPSAGNATVLCDAAGDQTYPMSVADGSGSAYFVWTDARQGTSNIDVYATHVSGATGDVSTGWLYQGAQVETTSGSALSVVACGDGLGGLLIVWNDYRASETDIYAMRLLISGVRAPGWPSNGATLCSASGSQMVPSVIPDGSGGLIATWSDNRSVAEWGIPYAQRLMANGTRPGNWDLDGDPVSLIGGGLCAIVPDGMGGAIGAPSAGSPLRMYAQRIDRFGALGNAEPVFTRIKDVAGDQGGFIRLQWKASYLDSVPLYAIDEYWLWRQTPATLARAAVSRGARWVDELSEAERAVARLEAEGSGSRLFRRANVASPNYAWEYLAAQPANASLEYSYVAPTVSDSLAGYNPRTVFMVEAHGAGNALWQSPPDSGYSVDNLAPLAPAPFTGAYSGGVTHLDWGANLESDFELYRLHRGSSSGFVPSPSNLVVQKATEGHDDVGPAGSYYKLAAVDVHGNVSAYSLLTPSETVGTGTAPPAELALGGPRPNPARGDCAIPVSLPRDSRLRIEVVDVSGRRVRNLVHGALPAGEHVVRWDGRDSAGHDVGNGLFFVRMSAEGRVFARRLLVAR